MPTQNLFSAIESAPLDEIVNIRHVKLSESEGIGVHVAEIHDSVKAHYHKIGSEFYQIISGTGAMFIGEITASNEVAWNSPFEVGAGDVFVVNPGQAHHLKKTSEKPLLIVFICPDEHLKNDRFIVENPKN